MGANVYIALVHYPVYNKRGEVITTAITNFDLHDVARTARTYNIKKVYFVQPLAAQRRLAEDILVYWQEGYGATYNPDRKEALRTICLTESIETAVADITARCGMSPVIVTTDARVYPNTIGYRWLREKMTENSRPYLLLFGTGWAIEKTTMESFDYILEPIYGRGDYNHLPVRSAVSIILDRLLGEPWWQSV